MTESMRDLTLEERNAALTTWLNDLTTVYEKCAAERDAQIESASYLAGKLAEVDRERLALRAACQNIVALASGWDELGALGPVSPLSWETVARMAMDYARAVLRSRGAGR